LGVNVFVLSVRNKFYVSEDRTWGSAMGNKSWNGLIGKLTRGEVDVAPTNLIATPDRLDVVDFLAPIVNVR
jgi:ABC-type amino acid transport substrate-binding protein